MGHYKNKQRNTTRSSNTSHSSQQTNTSSSSSTSNANIDDDFSVGIKVKSSSRNSTPKNNKKEVKTEVEKEVEKIQEPEPEKPRLPEWEEMGITEEEYWTMRKRTADLMRQEQLENYRNYMINQYDSVSYWKERMERLERMREPYNKARGWSAVTVASVEHIDKEIQECLQEIEYLEGNHFKEE